MKERIDAIIVMCCLEFGISPSTLLGPSKNRKAYDARTSASVMLQSYGHMSHLEIATLLNRERSTITYSINHAANRARVLEITAIVNKKFVRLFQLQPKQLF